MMKIWEIAEGDAASSYHNYSFPNYTTLNRPNSRAEYSTVINTYAESIYLNE